MWSPSPPFAVPSPATNTRRDALVFAPQGQGQQKSFLRMFNSNQRNRRVPKTEQKRNITRKTLSSGNINQRLNLQSAGGNTCFRERLRHLNNVHRLHFRTSNARVHDGSKYGRTRVPDMTLSFWNLNDKPTWETFFVATRNQWKRPAFKTSSRGPVRCGLRRSQETLKESRWPQEPPKEVWEQSPCLEKRETPAPAQEQRRAVQTHDPGEHQPSVTSSQHRTDTARAASSVEWCRVPSAKHTHERF